MSAIYNDIEPFVVQWLENLIAGGHIAAGTVTDQSIADLQAKDVQDATQFHAFAGIGVWSYALKLAGWPDDVPVWTGSCPCQPFSQAGKREGFDDERHLWPDWFRLIRACRPRCIFAEQISSDDGLDWLDVVLSDLEREGYQTAAFDLCAASLGAPHIRQRLFIVALADPASERSRAWRTSATRRWKEIESDRHRAVGGLADCARERPEWIWGSRGGRAGLEDGRVVDRMGNTNGIIGGQGGALARGRVEGSGAIERSGPCRAGSASGLADNDNDGRQELGLATGEDGHVQSGADADGRSAIVGDGGGSRVGGMGDADRLGVEGESGRGSVRREEAASETGLDGSDGAQHASSPRGLGDSGGDGDREHARELPSDEGKYGRRASERDHPSVFAGATRGFWSGADWVWCRDGKYRPVEPGLEPLAVGTAGRVGKLRAYGNAIVAQVAATFIRTVMDELIAREEESRV